MNCDRCEDIHYAQREGTQLESCRCNCHDKKIDWKSEYRKNEQFWGDGQILCQDCGSGDTGKPPEGYEYRTLPCKDVHYPPECNEKHIYFVKPLKNTNG